MKNENKHLEISVKNMTKLMRQIEHTMKTLVWNCAFGTIPTEEQLKDFDYKSILKSEFNIEVEKL